MISIESITAFFPPELRLPSFRRHILKEYVECLALDWISRSEWSSRLAFIGGTSLRLAKDIDRFSEDLDFDCKNFGSSQFCAMTDALAAYLRSCGLPAETKAKESERISAFRRSILFPGLLKSLGLSAFAEERFMMKIEAQDQCVPYTRSSANIKRCGFFFPVGMPPEPVLCAMKILALLSRAKGRDFYDAMFLLQRTLPDFGFLSAAHPGLDSLQSLKTALRAKTGSVNLKLKAKDVEHLLFNRSKADCVLLFPDFVESL